MRFAGVRASPRRVRRVMGDNDLLAPHRVGRAKSKPHDGTIVTNRLTRYQTQPSRQVVTTRERVSIAHRVRPKSAHDRIACDPPLAGGVGRQSVQVAALA